MGSKYRTNRNVMFSCKYHVVWCPKYRRSVLTDGVDKQLKNILKEVAKNTATIILQLEVMPDHVHLLLDVDPQFGIHRVVKRMKGRSSRELRQEFPTLRTRLPTLWNNSYFVSTAGGAPRAAIKRYIETQKEV